jgi:hypothetical protein
MFQSSEMFCALITADHRARSASMNSVIAAARCVTEADLT